MATAKKTAVMPTHASSSLDRLPKPRKNLASRKIHTEGRIVAKKESQQQHNSANNAKKRHRWRPGTVVLREVRRYQNSTDFLIAKAPFRRLVREIVSNLKDSFRMSPTCVEALQESTELYVTSVLTDANLCTLHANRVTVYPKDIQLALRLRGERL
ncbi:histone H3 variant [Trypanosoma theileri]|uniref:Histone H3 variant n=1 Tax=Trypanosoma theileri TaxID=67003 RepID=A0A1X0P6L2_9TRYP|nr:histone H3 variant [Trypanosoma theileri]ORC92471.1 histone H3 variant [Trypanosoma theileri]